MEESYAKTWLLSANKMVSLLGTRDWMNILAICDWQSSLPVASRQFCYFILLI